MDRSSLRSLAVLPAACGAIDAHVPQSRHDRFHARAQCARSRRWESEDAPSDLLLRLDLRIEHLLVDEFQDTSFTQLALIRQLTAGWQEGDGRTLFAVGDPMQSIYRFREAEVRVFVEAQEERKIADVPVESLVLSRNFRAQAGLVAWVNGVFPRVMGPRSDPWRGAVAFAPAIPVDRALPGPAATLDLESSASREALAVVRRIRAAEGEGAPSIAVLVRARAHLDCVLPALRDAGIAFTAIDLDALGERQAVQDLVSLTHALLQPADRLAWLAVLRAPWCGLTLPDLFAVAAAADASPSRSVASLLDRPDAVTALSADARTRFAKLAACLHPALSARGRATLASRARGAWLALGGPATLDEAVDLSAVERYFALVAEHEMAGEIVDWNSFLSALAVLRAEPDAAPRLGAGDDASSCERPRIRHGHHARPVALARGERRFVAALAAQAARPSACPGRRQGWRARPRLRISQVSRVGGGACGAVAPALRWLHAGEAAAAPNRDGAGDRGRRHAASVEGAAPRIVARATLGGTRRFDPGAEDERGHRASPPARAPLLRRLPAMWKAPVPEPGAPAVPMRVVAVAETLPFDWARETARQIGVVAHRMFAEMAREGITAWNSDRIAMARTADSRGARR